MEFVSALLKSMPGAVAQGMIWGIMAIGVYITYRILDVADLTVDGSIATGGAVCVLLTLSGVNVWIALLAAVLAGMLAGFLTGVFHTFCGIPAILAGILTQLALYSVNLRIMGWGTGGGKANLPVSVDKYSLLVSARYVRDLALNNPILALTLFCIVIIGLLFLEKEVPEAKKLKPAERIPYAHTAAPLAEAGTLPDAGELPEAEAAPLRAEADEVSEDAGA